MRREGKSLVRQCRKAKRNAVSPAGGAAKADRQNEFRVLPVCSVTPCPGRVFGFEPVRCLSFDALPPATLCEKGSKARFAALGEIFGFIRETSTCSTRKDEGLKTPSKVGINSDGGRKR